MAGRLARLWPGGDDDDWARFGFALAGLSIESVSVGPGPPDELVTAAKMILPKTGKCVFRTTLARIVKRMFHVFWSERGAAGVEYAGKFSGLLKAVVGKGDDGIMTFKEVVTESDTLTCIAAIHRAWGDESVDMAEDAAKNPDLGVDAAGGP